MPKTIISHSNTMTLEEVIARLSSREVVEGIVIIGSAGENKLSPASDYDLLIVLSDMPAPLHVALTHIDQRLTDIIFITVAEIDHILTNNEPVDADSWIGRTIRWLQVGQIAFDRSERLHRAQRKVQTGQWHNPVGESDMYPVWFGINYDLRQTKRILASDDPVYLMAVDIRLLRSLFELWWSYFQFRQLRPGSEKEGIRYLATHDPAYLELFKQCLAETDRESRVKLYEQLAALTTVPAGGLWEDGATAIQFKPGTKLQPDVIEDALDSWESLITD